MHDHTYPTDFEQQWRTKFPLTLTKLFAFYELLCTFSILGCEIGSILIDHFNATIYVGIWSGIFLLIAAILQLISVSCRYTYRCATYTLIFQCIALFFTICVIGFDAYFLIVPTTCFFPSTLCNSAAPRRGLFYSTDRFHDIKIPLIKGQLATAVVMFAFCIDYIIIYVVIRIHAKKKSPAISEQITINNDNNNINNNTNENSQDILEINPVERNRSSTINLSLNSSSVSCVRHSRWSIGSLNLEPVDEN